MTLSHTFKKSALTSLAVLTLAGCAKQPADNQNKFQLESSGEIVTKVDSVDGFEHYADSKGHDVGVFTKSDTVRLTLSNTEAVVVDYSKNQFCKMQWKAGDKAETSLCQEFSSVQDPTDKGYIVTLGGYLSPRPLATFKQ